MCYLENHAAENAGEDVLDPLTFKLERAKIQIELEFINRNLNNALIQVPSDPFPIQEQEQPFEYAHNTFDICNTLAAYIETFTNFNKENLEFISNDFIEECEIQAILRGEY
jgi:hypothetical protein